MTAARRTIGRMLGVTVLLMGGAVCGMASVSQGATSHVFELEVVVSEKIPPLRATTKENEAARISVDGVGTFEFTPTLKKPSESVVEVVIHDAAETPPRKLGAVEVRVAGERVQTKTSPSFGVKVVRMRDAK